MKCIYFFYVSQMPIVYVTNIFFFFETEKNRSQKMDDIDGRKHTSLDAATSAAFAAALAGSSSSLVMPPQLQAQTLGQYQGQGMQRFNPEINPLQQAGHHMGGGVAPSPLRGQPHSVGQSAANASAQEAIIWNLLRGHQHQQQQQPTHGPVPGMPQANQASSYRGAMNASQQANMATIMQRLQGLSGQPMTPGMPVLAPGQMNGGVPVGRAIVKGEKFLLNSFHIIHRYEYKYHSYRQPIKKMSSLLQFSKLSFLPRPLMQDHIT